MNIIRSWLRSWLGITDARPTKVEVMPMSIAQATLERAGELNLVYRRVEKPKLMPGVIPANTTFAIDKDPGLLGPYLGFDDGAMQPFWQYAQVANCGLGFPGYPYLAELSQRSEYRAPSETMSGEMTREWIEVKAKGKQKAAPDDPSPTDDREPGGLEDKIEQINEALKEFKVREAFREAALQDGLFGRSQIFINIEGQDSDERRQLPLVVDKATIPKGSLIGFKVIEPIWTTPYTYDSLDPASPAFFKPRAWYVLGKKTHASRLMTFVSREVPDMLKPAYNFGGLSMTQLMEPYVFQWLRTRNSVSDLIHNFSVMVLKTDMTNILSGQPDKPGGLMDRAKLFTKTRDNQGLMLLDMAREDLVNVAAPLSGLDELQAQAQEHMAAPSHIPLVKLLGITPTGLNASSEGEIKVFYDFVRSMQQLMFEDHLNKVLKIIQLHLFGDVDDAISFEFIPLTSPTVKELSEIRKSDAEADKTYVDMGAVSPDEVRERLAASPDSGFNNLSGEAPGPPEPPLDPNTALKVGAAAASGGSDDGNPFRDIEED